MTLVNKISKTFKWMRWSTVTAILFYMFFIGLILNSTLQSGTSNKVQSSLVKKQIGGSSSSSTLPGNMNAGAQQSPEAQRDVEKLPTSLSASSAVLVQKTQQPETVILAGSSVNEKQILAKAFRKADKNNDSYLDIQELARYVNKRINDHIEWARQMNPSEFRKVDISPGDGLITWEEYHTFFLKEHGMTENDIDQHSEVKHTALNRKAREEMMRDKARWSEAARTDLFSLTIDEYLSFRHPESSVSNLLELVEDLLRLFDLDGDEQLTIDEFADVTVDDDDDFYRRTIISKTVEERRAEFKRIIDKNNDGRADRGELLNYVDPKSPRYSLQESATLISLADVNKDGKLSLTEIVDSAEIFLTSKMIDTANSFHEEF